MTTQEIIGRCAASVEAFDRHEHRTDGVQVIESVCGGLTLLRDAFYARVHSDVEVHVGLDSMITPISEEKTERTTKLEIEIYQIAVSAAAAESHAYVADCAWYRDWLAQLRLGAFHPDSRAARRLSYYATKSSNEQRLAFSNVLATALPESGRAPLILLKILPLAVEIATALAFGKSTDAQARRHEQVEILPSIADCYHCHGKLLENGEQCTMCGNPLWNFDWLTSADE